MGWSPKRGGGIGNVSSPLFSTRQTTLLFQDRLPPALSLYLTGSHFPSLALPPAVGGIPDPNGTLVERMSFVVNPGRLCRSL